MNFKVNDYTIINNFKRLNEFETITKFGSPYRYEKFTGSVSGQKVSGLICCSDSNIYKMKYNDELTTV